jgi:hypothetical protein
MRMVMVFVWLIAGCVFVSVPFYLFYDPFTLWPSLYASGIAAAVYHAALLMYFLRKRPGTLVSIAVPCIALLLLVTSVLHWRTMDVITAWQRAQLGRVRTLIADNILLNDDVCNRSLPVLAAYHAQSGKAKNVVPLFVDMYAGKINDGLFPSTDPYDKSTRRYVSYQGDTAVVLISVDTVAYGSDPHYRNINGSTGRLQRTTTLTARGVHYERNN